MMWNQELVFKLTTNLRYKWRIVPEGQNSHLVVIDILGKKNKLEFYTYCYNSLQINIVLFIIVMYVVYFQNDDA